MRLLIIVTTWYQKFLILVTTWYQKFRTTMKGHEQKYLLYLTIYCIFSVASRRAYTYMCRLLLLNTTRSGRVWIRLDLLPYPNRIFNPLTCFKSSRSVWRVDTPQRWKAMFQIKSFNSKGNRGIPTFLKAAPHNSSRATSWSLDSGCRISNEWAGTTSSMVHVVPIASLLLVLNGVRIETRNGGSILRISEVQNKAPRSSCGWIVNCAENRMQEWTQRENNSWTTIFCTGCIGSAKRCDGPSAKTTVGRPAGAGMEICGNIN
jgi:hypothetical protein